MLTRTFPILGQGTKEDPYRLEIPEGIPFRVVEQHGTESVVVELSATEDDFLPEEEKTERERIKQAIQDALSDLTSILNATDEQLTNNQLLAIRTLARNQRRIIRLLVKQFVAPAPEPEPEPEPPPDPEPEP